ncbi:pepsin A-5-like [Pipistrellus kuhlii]|uniref:pepsin A-5-like n=1 Tax=Pipistrellus kuhlii TaxID=59472 RepID=UPI001E270D3A|nr:pepsin A-5-like [Pipistrellus kuhlii]
MWWIGLLSLVALSEGLVTIPLTKIKSTPESLREKDLLRDYLRQHPHSHTYQFLSKKFVSKEPLRNYKDVSVRGPAHSLLLVLAQRWGSPRAGKPRGVGAPAGSKARMPGTLPGDEALPLGSWSVVTESSHGQAAGTHPSWAKDTRLGPADQVLVGQILSF